MALTRLVSVIRGQPMATIAKPASRSGPSQGTPRRPKKDSAAPTAAAAAPTEPEARKRKGRPGAATPGEDHPAPAKKPRPGANASPAAARLSVTPRVSKVAKAAAAAEDSASDAEQTPSLSHHRVGRPPKQLPAESVGALLARRTFERVMSDQDEDQVSRRV